MACSQLAVASLLAALGAAAPAAALDLAGTWHVAGPLQGHVRPEPGRRALGGPRLGVRARGRAAALDRLPDRRAPGRERPLRGPQPRARLLDAERRARRRSSRPARRSTRAARSRRRCAAPTPAGWKSSSAQQRSVAFITYEETWSIEGLAGQPVFTRVDVLGGGGADEAEGRTRYATSEVSADGKLLRGSFDRDGTRKGSFTMTRVGAVKTLSTEGPTPNEKQAERVREEMLKQLDEGATGRGGGEPLRSGLAACACLCSRRARWRARRGREPRGRVVRAGPLPRPALGAAGAGPVGGPPVRLRARGRRAALPRVPDRALRRRERPLRAPRRRDRARARRLGAERGAARRDRARAARAGAGRAGEAPARGRRAAAPRRAAPSTRPARSASSRSSRSTSRARRRASASPTASAPPPRIALEGRTEYRGERTGPARRDRGPLRPRRAPRRHASACCASGAPRGLAEPPPRPPAEPTRAEVEERLYRSLGRRARGERRAARALRRRRRGRSARPSASACARRSRRSSPTRATTRGPTRPPSSASRSPSSASTPKRAAAARRSVACSKTAGCGHDRRAPGAAPGARPRRRALDAAAAAPRGAARLRAGAGPRGRAARPPGRARSRIPTPRCSSPSATRRSPASRRCARCAARRSSPRPSAARSRRSSCARRTAARGVGRALAEEALRWMAARGLPRAALQVAAAQRRGPALLARARLRRRDGRPRAPSVTSSGHERPPPSSLLNPIAQELNARLEAAAPEVLAMLSPLGRRLYFPRGILTQSAEAKEKAHRFNATIGIATENGAAMHLPSVQRHVARHRARRRRELRAGRGPPGPAQALAREAARGEPEPARQGLRPADRDERPHPRPRAGGRPLRRRRRRDPAARQALGQLPPHLRGAPRRARRDLPLLRRRRLRRRRASPRRCGASAASAAR